MKYTVQDGIGGRKVHLGDGAIIATFSNDGAGQKAFAMFVRGVANSAPATLWDANASQYLVGDLGQLDGGKE
jgi:hypothetical protein